MAKMEIAKFIFRFKIKMLPIYFDNYFTNLSEIHKNNTRQKAENGYYHHSFHSEFGRKQLNHECLILWKSISLAKKSAGLVNSKECLKMVF